MLNSPLQPVADQPLHLRAAAPEFDQLRDLVFLRYPKQEWASFARFGWRETSEGLIVTLAGIDAPLKGDLDENVGHVVIDEQYTLRIALEAEKHGLAVGVIHSHPMGAAPRPSAIDDDMDTYFATYFSDFAPGRPYLSLILSIIHGQLVISGRAFWHDRWMTLRGTSAERIDLETWPLGVRPKPPAIDRDRAARFASAFGDQALRRLRRSTVAVIGAGGTGSAAIEVLARAGVGRVIIIDPDTTDRSNLERNHGSFPQHADQRVPKVEVARNHVRAIDPKIEVDAIVGRLPQREVVDAVMTADVAIGCTDRQHSRLALSDLTFRYLLPAIDCGVLLEGKDGAVTGQVAQLVRFRAADPCALCRDMIEPQRVAQELMSKGERARRRAAARDAQMRGDDPNQYWDDVPQLYTVGYLTTTVGALAAGYAIGWLTGRFDPPFERLQMNFVAPFFDTCDDPQSQRPDCPCAKFRGWADQAGGDALITAPDHWPLSRRIL